MVDRIPIRVFRNYAKEGVAYPTKRPMYGFSSIWAAEDWATQGGRVKTDWSKAPFVAEYREISLQVCECASAACAETCASSRYAAPGTHKLTDKQLRELKAVQLGYTIYDYCKDAKWPNGTQVPLECGMDQY